MAFGTLSMIASESMTSVVFATDQVCPRGFVVALVLDALGECGGDCANDFDGDGVCDEFLGPCFDGRYCHGYEYNLVVIGRLLVCGEPANS